MILHGIYMVYTWYVPVIYILIHTSDSAYVASSGIFLP